MRLLIVGDGFQRRALEDDARRLDVADRVRFVGAVPHAEVQPYLYHAAVVALPSWYEERGRVVLEVMAAGRPVVATRTGGIAVTVRDGENGVLVPPRDPHALAAAIERVLEDDALAASMGVAGMTTASEHGIAALVEATLATYEGVLEGVTEHRAPLEV